MLNLARLKPHSTAHLYDKIVPADHLLRHINQLVDFSFIRELVKDRYTPNFGRPAEDPEFMLRQFWPAPPISMTAGAARPKRDVP
jgi:hypothetical protein